MKIINYFNTKRRENPISVYYKLLFFAWTLFTSSAVSAQSRIINGVVVDDIGVTLPGVSVKIKGNSVSANTDANGKYSIKVLDNQSVLVFSFIGFEPKEVTVGTKTSVNVTLVPNNISLNEVIVQTGYGTTAKKDVTGSVGVVSVKDLQKAPVTSFEQALAGRVAGVQVVSGDGQPGDGVNITIRGNNSINNSNSPLYVIDGFPIENPNNNAINPAEIETIDVLKDASATAIYGSRGANGVIIITTKRGKTGEPTISYNGYAGFNKITSKVDVLSPYEFVKLQAEINPVFAGNDYFSKGQTLDTYRDVAPVNFQDKLYKASPFQDHYISLSGGTDKTKYAVSGSITNQDGIIVNSGFTRYQGRAVLDQNIGKKLKIGTNINYSSSKSFGQTPRSQNNFGGNDVGYNLMYQLWSYRPVTGSLNPDDLLDSFLDPNNTEGSILDYRVNPYDSFTNEYRGVFSNTFVGNAYAEYAFTKDLTFRTTGGVSLSSGRRENFYNSKTRQGSPLTYNGQLNGVNGSINQTNRNDYSFENVLTYSKKIDNDNSFSIKGIYGIQIDETQGFGFTALKLQNESLGIAGLGRALSGNVTPSTDVSTYRLQSFAAIFNYQFKGGKYLFTGNFRADGSSKFSEGNRYGYFPSGALAWRFSEEKFIKDLNIVSSGKLRGGYGLVGNNRVADFAYISPLESNGGGPGGPAYYPFGGVIDNSTQAVYIATLGNQKLKWETTGSLDIGLEFGVLNDRVLVEADYYKKHTYDLLLNSKLALSAGTPNTIIDNIGETSNEGFEFTLNSQLIKKADFGWNTSFNITFNKNKILALSGGQNYLTSTVSGSGTTFTSRQGYIAQIGKPISLMYGYIYDGNYQVEDFDLLNNGTYRIKDNVPFGVGTQLNQTRGGSNPVQPGDPKYRDINGDGLIDQNDQTIIGDPNPLHFGGWNNNFSYKSFDLNVFLQWSYGNETLNANRLYLEGGFPAQYGINQLASYADRWTPENRSNTLFRSSATGAAVYSSRYIEDASFLRLKTVQLGYNLPTSYLQKVNLKSVRLYTAAQNILTFTNYSATDPENSTRGTGLTAGYDFSAYPRAFTVTFGLNVSL